MNDDNKTLLDNDIPQKFLDAETGEINMENFVSSYRALETKLSQQPRAPKSYDEYSIDCSHGLFEPDEDINKRLQEKGFTHEQAQELYDIAAERMVPMIIDLANDFKADREVEKLINHFGGTNQWKQVSKQLLAFGQKHLPEDVLDNLSSSFEGVLALHKMMQSGEPGLQRVGGMSASSMEEKDLQAMMRNPKYWRDKDPAFIAKVTEGFQNMYGQ